MAPATRSRSAPSLAADQDRTRAARSRRAAALEVLKFPEAATRARFASVVAAHVLAGSVKLDAARRLLRAAPRETQRARPAVLTLAAVVLCGEGNCAKGAARILRAAPGDAELNSALVLLVELAAFVELENVK